MFNFKTSDLKAALPKLTAIKTNTLLPVMAYWRVERSRTGVLITKTNLNSFIKIEVPAESGPEEKFLVPEKMIINFLTFATEERLVLALKAGKVIITDLKSSINSPEEPIENFPTVTGRAEGEGWPFDPAYARIAAAVVNNDEIPSPSNHVFIRPNGTGGGDGFCLFFMPESKGEQPISLRGEVIRALPNNILNYSSGDNYDYFYTPGVEYGFIKSEIPNFDLGSFFTAVPPGGFTISKSVLLRFNEMAMSAAVNAAEVAAEWIPKGQTLRMEMKDEAYSVDFKTEAAVQGTPFAFAYLPSIMNKLLKAIPYDELRFVEAKAGAFMVGPDNSLAIIQKLKKKN
jgi:hypothetical protein